jgi:pimeloyl-ACP methyl ester carboxylesterase
VVGQAWVAMMVGDCEKIIELRPRYDAGEIPELAELLSWAYVRSAELMIGQAKSSEQDQRAKLLQEAEQQALKAEEVQQGVGAPNLARIAALTGREDDCRKWLGTAKEHGRLPSKLTAQIHGARILVNVAGLRLEYRRIPPRTAGGPTLVLLHEGLGCVGLWKHFPERLAALTGCSVFLWSRASFGRSDPISLPRPLDYLEREVPLVPEVLKAAGIDRAVLIGHSDGGTIALLYAASDLDGRVEGVVTMAAHVFVEDVTIKGIQEAERSWTRGEMRRRLARWHGANVESAFHGWCDTWLDPGFRDWNIERSLPAVRVPVLAIQGAEDQYGTPAQVEAITSQVSGPAEALLLPGAGHAPHVDQPEAVLAAISRFVREHARPGRPAAPPG